MCRSTNWLTAPGNDMSSATPPPVWTTIWSATITDSAIVISAWRRSWPWFQRRKQLLHGEPEQAGHERRDEQHDEPVDEADLRRGDRGVGAARDDAALHVDGHVGRHEIERPVRHVDHAHQPEDSVKPLATTK